MRTSGRAILLAVTAAVLLLLVGGRMAAEFVVSLLWFRSLELEEVFWTRWWAAGAVRAAVGVLAGGFVFANLSAVARTLGTIRVRRRFANIEIAERLPQAYIVGAILAVAVLTAWWLSAAMGDPIDVLAALRAERWGVDDPVLGRDLSFYVFQYPILERAQVLLTVLLFWTSLLVTAVYVATGGIRWSAAGAHFTPAARRHLGLLVAGFVVALALDLWLERYALLMDGNGIGGAIGHTDVHARLPAKAVLAGLAFLAAGALAAAAWRESVRLAVGGLAALVVGLAVGEWIYPRFVQTLVVEPNELARETPYIEHGLRFTRLGYGLADLAERPLPYRGVDSLPPLERLAGVLPGLPLWDQAPLLAAFQPQALKPYYDLPAVQYDRYGPPGAQEPIAISVRELDASRLPAAARTWQNLHLNYVRGEGVVATSASRITEGGEPLLYLHGLAPVERSPEAPADLVLERPEVYFGEKTEGYVVLPPRPAGDRPEPVGIRLDSWWKRLAYAWAFESKNLLLSGEVGEGSRVVHLRAVRHRAEAIAPYLLYPSDVGEGILPVLHEGRVVWLLDAYTGSPYFPLARGAPEGDWGLRYVRNSVKVAIDAVTGEVDFYAIDPRDPVLRTYSRLFPGLFRPAAEMPGELRRHLRYPAELQALQGQVLREYHVRDARAFYDREDAWDVATELYRSNAITYAPFYAILPVPGEEEPELVTALPFVAAGRQNLTGLLVTRNDPPHYGEQILFGLPRGTLVPGPQQIEAMVDQNPEISEQLSLWKRGGSDVIRGHMILVPLDGALVYVEPIYLEAEESAIPQLERVVAASGRRVVMRPTAEGAVRALYGTEDAPAARRSAPRTAPAPEADASARTLAEARRILGVAEGQLRAGDWAGFGRSWERLRALLGGGEDE